MVLAQGRRVVEGVELSRSPRGPDGVEGVRKEPKVSLTSPGPGHQAGVTPSSLTTFRAAGLRRYRTGTGSVRLQVPDSEKSLPLEERPPLSDTHFCDIEGVERLLIGGDPKDVSGAVIWPRRPPSQG